MIRLAKVQETATIAIDQKTGDILVLIKIRNGNGPTCAVVPNDLIEIIDS